MSACSWCHRFVGGEAESCLFPGSEQCAYEYRKECEAHAINESKRGVINHPPMTGANE